MEGRATANPNAKRGGSKEKRSDCPLITLRLVVNEHGFTQHSSFLPGNISEPKTLQEAIAALNVPGNLFKPTIVMDAGIATEENLTWLRDNHFHYIVVARQDPPSEELEAPPVLLGDSHVKGALVKTTDSEERWLYCESPDKEAVAGQIKTLFCTRFEADLQKLAEGLTRPNCRKKLGKILERVGRLKEKHKRISGCYEVHVHSTDGQIATAIEWQPLPEKLEAKLNGSYFLRTNLLNEPLQKLWEIYRSLAKVEDAFRFMKSSLGLRPIFHEKKERLDGHLWITLLAYQLIQACLYQCHRGNLFHHWPTLRNRLWRRMRITMCAKLEQGQVLYHRSTTQAEESQKEIYKAIGISPQISKAKKIIV
ncbi:MAG: IS1634 family transposase [Verrucomicrobia bacterium]|nr:IS1634 family transposase [Verrucomicrobiota bacterium]